MSKKPQTKPATPKQDKFAREYVKCSDASAAYRLAYSTKSQKPETIWSNAYRLLANTQVASRIKYWQGQAAKQQAITVDSLCRELDEARAIALKTGKASAAVSASMGKAKLCGLGVERKQVDINATLTVDQANRLLAQAGLIDE